MQNHRLLNNPFNHHYSWKIHELIEHTVRESKKYTQFPNIISLQAKKKSSELQLTKYK